MRAERRFRLCIAGATGETGRRVAKAAAASGIEPLLAGRDAPALSGLASGIGGAEIRVLDLRDPGSIDRALAGADAVASCVGPFTRRGLPIAEAAVRTGTPYVDPAGEPGFCVELIRRFGDASSTLVPAIGASSLLGDLAAAHLANEQDRPTRGELTVEYRLDGMRPSAGTLRSMVDILGDGAIVVRDGVFRRVLPGGPPRRLPGGVGVRFSVPDPVVISRYSSAPRIEAFLLTDTPRLTGGAFRAAARAFRRPRLRSATASALERLPVLPMEGRADFAATARAEGNAVTASISANAYELTAAGLVQVAQAAAARHGRGGVRAASEVLGDPLAAARRLGIELTEEGATAPPAAVVPA